MKLMQLYSLENHLAVPYLLFISCSLQILVTGKFDQIQ